MIRHPYTATGVVVNDIQMITRHVMYAAVGTNIIVSYDGGCTFTSVESCAARSNHPDATVLDILACPYSFNDVVFVGEIGGVGYLLDGLATH